MIDSVLPSSVTVPEGKYVSRSDETTFGTLQFSKNSFRDKASCYKGSELAEKMMNLMFKKLYISSRC